MEATDSELMVVTIKQPKKIHIENPRVDPVMMILCLQLMIS
jgi:hypothetical protein